MSSGAICTPGEGGVVRAAAIVMHGQARWVLAKAVAPRKPRSALRRPGPWPVPRLSLGWSDGTRRQASGHVLLAVCAGANGGPWGLPGLACPWCFPADGGPGREAPRAAAGHPPP